MYDKIGLKIPLIVLVVAGALWAMLPLEEKIILDESLAGGTELFYEVKGASTTDAVRQAKAVIEKRLNITGAEDIKVIVSGTNRLTIKLPGMSAEMVDRYKKLIENMGELVWKLDAEPEVLNPWSARLTPEMTQGLRSEDPAAVIQARRDLPRPPTGYSLHFPPLPTATNQEERAGLGPVYLLWNNNSIPGVNIKQVFVSYNQQGRPAVAFDLDSDGRVALTKLTTIATETNPHRSLVILLNNEVVSDPVVNEPLTTGSGIITFGRSGGEDALKQANDLIAVIQAGSLKSQLNFLYQFTTGVGLGQDQIDKGKATIAATFLLVIAFMLLYYLGAGIVANVGLLMNLVLVLGMMCFFKATFTIPGIAGLILTVGMAVDANILIFERIREEKRKGKTLRQAVKNGYDRAFRTIVDANVTTLLTAAILYWAGSVEIRGFAVVLSLGILCSMFTTLFVMKVFFTILVRANIFRSMTMLRLIGQPKIRFLALGRGALVFSAIAITIGLVAFFSRGKESFGIDFLGGSRYHIVLKEPVPIGQVRAKVDAMIRNAHIQRMEPMAIEVGEETKKTTENTEYVISVVATEVDRLGAEHGVADQSAHEAVRGLILEMFQGKFVPRSGLGMGIRPLYGKITFTTKEPITKDRADAIHGALAGLRYSDRDIQVEGSDSTDNQPKTFSILLNLEEKTFKDSVAAVRNALSVLEQTVELAQGTGSEPRLSADEQEERNPLILTPMVEILGATLPTDDEMKGYMQAALNRANAATPTLESAEAPTKYDVLRAQVHRDGFQWNPDTRNFVPVTVDVLSSTLKPGDPLSLKTERDEIQKLLERQTDKLRVSPGPLAREEVVGKAIAETFKQDAFFAIVAALIAIVAYIWIRFRHLRYGFAAVAALAHDVLFTLGALALLAYAGVEIKIDLAIIAAFLTIVGYSLNDTIVVFDRIRENSTGRHAKHYVDDVNTSINQTLSRTMLTSFTTFMVVATLAIFGGGIIRGFALSMMIGVVVGTYSSIFVASPTVVWLHNREQQKKQGLTAGRVADQAAAL